MQALSGYYTSVCVGLSHAESLMATRSEASSATFSLGDLGQVMKPLGVMDSCSTYSGDHSNLTRWLWKWI